ncbi:MAG: two-component system response regulator [Giesbergeria sp.]|uniref:response regulator n=1 Tax=Giesbergeria sp. TaxID=2818473 RepID=UPI002602DC4D|nr:two-component system response regulator [Giesbergeria sp.]MDD2609706.1 two-component system response regulator [Giesbergeria sp.]
MDAASATPPLPPPQWSERPLPVVLVVDDTPDNLALMAELLKERYSVKVAANGERALKIAQTQPQPDLVLLDIMMPDMDGYEVCRQLKAQDSTKDIPVIFLTARTDTEDERQGLALGAVDYITKPVSPPILLARVQTHLALKATADFLRDKSAYLEREVALRTLEVQAIQDVTIMAMTSLAETRDDETGNHIRRTQLYVKALAERLRLQPRFEAQLNERMIELIYKSAPLHDIGKIGISDAILLKPGKLTPEEYATMQRHPILGRKAIEGAERRLGMRVPFLRIAKDMAYSHHEHWDGSGYPEGLVGEEIPLPGRLMALADVYDALVHPRIYRPQPFTHEQACTMLLRGRGTQFDPKVIDAFIDIADDFRRIARNYPDGDRRPVAQIGQPKPVAQSPKARCWLADADEDGRA